MRTHLTTITHFFHSEKFYETHVTNGQKVRKGDLLVTFDMDGIKAAGYKLTTPMIVCNTDDYRAVKPLATGTVKAGQDFMEVVER